MANKGPTVSPGMGYYFSPVHFTACYHSQDTLELTNMPWDSVDVSQFLGVTMFADGVVRYYENGPVLFTWTQTGQGQGRLTVSNAAFVAGCSYRVELIAKQAGYDQAADALKVITAGGGTTEVSFEYHASNPAAGTYTHDIDVRNARSVVTIYGWTPNEDVELTLQAGYQNVDPASMTWVDTPLMPIKNEGSLWVYDFATLGSPRYLRVIAECGSGTDNSYTIYAKGR